MEYLLVSLSAFSLSAIAVVILLATTQHHLHVTGDYVSSGPQKLHSETVPRVGGFAIALSVVIVFSAYAVYSPSEGRYCMLLFACLMPGFFAGFVEDITKRVSPLMRLMATMIGAAAAAALFGLQISSVGIPLVDEVLSLPGVGEFAMALAVGGAAHAFNIIDGQNGLSSGTALISLAVIFILSASLGLTGAAIFSMVLSSAILGFMLFNFPNGRIFLGDGGAYMIGGAIGLLAVAVVEKSGGLVSPWWALLVVIYPVWETLFSVFRRKLVRSDASQPDALHLHSILRRSDHGATGVIGQSSAPRLWGLFLPFACLSLLFYDAAVELALLSFTFAAVYLIVYFKVSRAIGISPLVAGCE